ERAPVHGRRRAGGAAGRAPGRVPVGDAAPRRAPARGGAAGGARMGGGLGGRGAPGISSVRVGFVHPELGLGGAERLVVDAALELQGRGHEVTLFTAAYDPARSFPETRALDVRVHGAFLPRQVAGRAQALCTIARSSWAAAALALGAERFDVVMFDLVAWPIPVVRALDRRRPRLVYYCHYPDQLLARARGAVSTAAPSSSRAGRRRASPPRSWPPAASPPACSPAWAARPRWSTPASTSRCTPRCRSCAATRTRSWS